MRRCELEKEKEEDAFDGPLSEIDDEPTTKGSLKTKKPRRRRAKADELVVYDIPPVETKATTYKGELSSLLLFHSGEYGELMHPSCAGRLGYACLNTILRNKKPAKDAIFCSRTCRIASMQEHGIEFAKELGLKNARDLLTLVEWNEENNIKFMRVSSEMFPFASHKVWGYSLEYARAELEAVGKKAKEYGHRLTTHPGQFTQRE